MTGRIPNTSSLVPSDSTCVGGPPSAPWPAVRVLRLKLLLIVLLGGAFHAGPIRFSASVHGQAPPTTGTITEIRFEGNESIGDDEIRRKIRSRPGRSLELPTVDDDQKALLETRWFTDVKASVTRDPENAEQVVLTFTVREAPVLREVQFLGRKQLKLKDLEDRTGLRVGARADHLKVMMAVNDLQHLYEEKGYLLAEIKLREGGQAGDTRAIFEIFEGPKSKVTSITFAGNTIVTDARLRTQIDSKTAILGVFGGTLHRDDLEIDARKLREYYQGMGFFEVKVTPTVKETETPGEARIEFVISEGPQYRVRHVAVEGNKLVATEKLLAGLKMHSGQPFSDVMREADAKALQDLYGEIGCIDAMVELERKYADPEKEPGVIDLVYRIEEGEPFRVGRLINQGNDRTRDRVMRREAEMAGLVPGEPLNVKNLELYKKRLENLGIFVKDTQHGGKPIEVKIANRRPPNRPYGELARLDLDDVIRTRLQNPVDDDLPLAPPSSLPPADEPVVIDDLPLAPGLGPAGVVPYSDRGPFDPAPGIVPQPIPPIDVPAPGVVGGDIVAPEFGGELVPLGEGEPPGTFPTQPGMNQTNVGPNRDDPFPERSWADIVTNIEEGSTGRLQIGAGVTSFGGLNGTFIYQESNFDILNWPRSWRDFRDQRAFRGAQQDFRVELSAGNLINRANISFRDPYFLNMPGGYAMGLGLSGYAFTRVYQGQFNEYRGGGRFSLGSQFGTSTYADVALRVEDVRISNYYLPAPAEFLAVDGHTFLTSLRPSVRFDNRNDPYAPNKGQYLEAAFEQGWGTFTFPKVTLEGRKYFLTGSRPDGSGKRILTFRGYFGVTGQDTPTYERFYAGDFRSLRGFTYRGVGPFVLGRNVGGLMSALGSVEYQFPWTANDRFQQVVFCDFGTVEQSYDFTTFRAAVGTGLRIYMPQQMFGPLPLAFDFAVPVVKGPDDRDQLFTFFIGAMW